VFALSVLMCVLILSHFLLLWHLFSIESTIVQLSHGINLTFSRLVICVNGRPFFKQPSDKD